MIQVKIALKLIDLYGEERFSTEEVIYLLEYLVDSISTLKLLEKHMSLSSMVISKEVEIQLRNEYGKQFEYTMSKYGYIYGKRKEDWFFELKKMLVNLKSE